MVPCQGFQVKGVLPGAINALGVVVQWVYCCIGALLWWSRIENIFFNAIRDHIPPKNELLGIQHCLGFTLAILPRCKYSLLTAQVEKLRWEKCQGKHFNLIITCPLVIGQKMN